MSDEERTIVGYNAKIDDDRSVWCGRCCDKTFGFKLLNKGEETKIRLSVVVMRTMVDLVNHILNLEEREEQIKNLTALIRAEMAVTEKGEDQQ